MLHRRPRLETLRRASAAIAQLAPLITALTAAAVAGHNLGWW